MTRDNLIKEFSVVLMEVCGETVQVAAHVNRKGVEGRKAWLTNQLGEVTGAMALLAAACEIETGVIEKTAQTFVNRVQEHYSEEEE
jgi:hypothetical protein